MSEDKLFIIMILILFILLLLRARRKPEEREPGLNYMKLFREGKISREMARNGLIELAKKTKRINRAAKRAKKTVHQYAEGIADDLLRVAEGKASIEEGLKREQTREH